MCRKKFLLLLFLMFLCLGCGSRVVIQKYYVIEPPENSADTSGAVRQPLTDESCVILPPAISPVFASTKIAVRTRSNEVSYFYYHHWAVTPQEAIANFLQSEVRNASLFAASGSRGWRINNAYRIGSTVEYLEYLEQGDNASAHLQMKLTFVRGSDGEELYAHDFNRTVRLRRKNLNEFAAVISKILNDEMNVFLDGIQNYLVEAKSGS